MTQRAADTGDTWTPTAYPVEFLSLGTSGIGVPVRATITSFGPILLSKVLGLNQTQESTLGLIFHWADQQGLPLLDLKDLRSVIQYLTSDEGKPQLKALGAVSTTTAGVILRALVNLEAEGADTFFGEPELEPADLMRRRPGGTRHHHAARAGQSGGPAGDVLHVPDVGARRPVHDAARGRRRRQAQAGVLLRRGAPAVHRRVQGVPRAGRANGQADPLQGSRGVLLHPVADRRPQQRAEPARRPDPARAARVHPGRSEGAVEDGAHLPENRGVRPGVGADIAGHRRGRRHRALGEGSADAGGVDQDACAALADGHHRHRRPSPRPPRPARCRPSTGRPSTASRRTSGWLPGWHPRRPSRCPRCPRRNSHRNPACSTR